jgi:hypothetical protein
MVDTNLHLPASNLADAILERVGIACDNYFTVYLQGRQLKGDKTLESSGVLEGTRIEVKWCGRGGMDGDGNCSGGKRSVPPTSLIDKASIMPAIEARMLVKRFFVNVVPGDTAAVLQYTPLFGTRFTQSHPNGTGFYLLFFQAAALGAFGLKGQPPKTGSPSHWQDAIDRNSLSSESHAILLVLRLLVDFVCPLLAAAVRDTSTQSLVAGRLALEQRSTTQNDEAARLCAWLLTQLPLLSEEAALTLAKRFFVNAAGCRSIVLVRSRQP